MPWLYGRRRRPLPRPAATPSPRKGNWPAPSRCAGVGRLQSRANSQMTTSRVGPAGRPAKRKPLRNRHSSSRACPATHNIFADCPAKTMLPLKPFRHGRRPMPEAWHAPLSAINPAQGDSRSVGSEVSASPQTHHEGRSVCETQTPPYPPPIFSLLGPA